MNSKSRDFCAAGSAQKSQQQLTGLSHRHHGKEAGEGGSALHVARVVALLLCMSTLFSTFSVVASEKAAVRDPLCDRLLVSKEEMAGTILEDAKGDAKDLEKLHRVLAQKFSVMDFLSKDPKKNLAARAPNTVMNAAEYLLAILNKAGFREMLTPYARNKIRFSNALSGGFPEVRGRRIIGQWQPVENGIVNNIRNQADGLRAGNYPPLYLGPPGTGKSEISVVPPMWMYHFSKQEDLEMSFITFTWRNLDEIVLDGFSGKYANTLAAPTEASPVAILPEPVQKFAIEMSADSVRKLIGRPSLPKMVLDEQSKEIRTAILRFYEMKKGAPLDLSEIMKALDHHTVVHRVIVDDSYVTLLDSQGQDIDTGTLFGLPNPINRNILGPSDASSWFLNSTFARANRKYLGLDEVMTNSNELLKMYLKVIESRRYGVSGPSQEIDVVFVGFTNDVDYNKKIQEGHGALANRFRIEQLRGSVFPRLIEDLLYYSVQENLFQQKIDPSDDAISTPLDRYKWEEVVPIPQHQNITERFLGPEYRYRLFIGKEGPDQVVLAPHVGRLISDFAAATRFVTDVELANQRLPANNVSRLNEFQDPMARLRAYHGESAMSVDAYFDMIELGELLEEGSSIHPGLLTRNILKWWAECIERARLPENRNTLTPSIILQVFDEQMKASEQGGYLQAKGNQQRLDWINLMERIRNNWLIPTLRRDVLESYGEGNHTAKRAYYEVLAEFEALEATPGALVFDDKGLPRVTPGVKYTFEGKSSEVDVERLQFVARSFRDRTGQMLNGHQIGHFQGISKALSRLHQDDQPHNDLYGAVVEYYSMLAVKSKQLEQLVHYLTTRSNKVPENVRLEADNFLEAMARKGYNAYSAVVSAKMVSEEMRDTAPANGQRK